MEMKKDSMIRYIFRMLRLAECPWYLFLTILDKCFKDLKWAVLLVVFLNKFIGFIEMKANLADIVLTLCIYTGILIVIEVFTHYYNYYYKPNTLPKIQEKLKKKLFQKSIASDLADFDNPVYYNNYIWTLTKADETLNGIMNDLASLVSNILVTLCISGIFISLNYFIAIAVFVSVGVTVFIYSFIIKAKYEKDLVLNPYVTKAEYFKRIFYLKEYSKELRITNIDKLLMDQFDGNEDMICCVNKEYGKRLSLYNALNGLTISTLLDIGLRVLLTYHLIVTQKITLGEFTASSFAIWSLFSSLNGLMFGFNSFPEYALRAKTAFEFFDKKSQVYVDGKEEVKIKQDKNVISLNNVCFSYTKGGKPALKNINFQLRQGETVAVVGENGTGKSTLVKILMGLYEPTHGDILINDQELREVNIHNYREIFAVVFQDFSFFSANLAQNIVLDLEYDKVKIQNALEKSLFYQDNEMRKIPLDSIMTKEFDDEGIVLSGGQSQKFISSRAFLNNPFIIMDEPSSALDAASEMNLNDLVLKNPNGKGMLIIAHRLTTAKRADRIIVLSGGKVIEEGSHEELMNLKGEYERMFTLQAKQYSMDTDAINISFN